ncbi:MAG TPA: YdeI/OmpD-associated family protein [Rickettsiales bacterium]|nr:YdeI/OmpD-associated family protein [Rickettsiales bacterium]
MAEQNILSFPHKEAWEKWIKQHQADSNGVWLKLIKKSVDEKALTYAEALDVALCYGWIDGQKKTHDESAWLQKFTPRRKGSLWSKKNREHVERLIKEGRMQAAGLKEIEAAKQDGRWEKAYDAASSATMPEDFLQALAKDKKASAFFATLNKANLYAITWRLQTAKKPETRQKRMESILAMLHEGKKFH